MNGPKTHPGNLMVLYEDNHLIAVSKRAGDIVQGDKTGDTPLPETVKDYIAHKYQKPGKVFLGVVHRLDRPTTGVIVFARTSKALSRMNRLFAEGGTRKTYWALVGTPPPETAGRLVHWLERNQSKTSPMPGPKKSPAASRRSSITDCSAAWTATTCWKLTWKPAGTTRSAPSWPQ